VGLRRRQEHDLPGGLEHGGRVRCLDGSALPYATCRINVGLEQAALVDLPPLRTFHDLAEADRLLLMALSAASPARAASRRRTC
jgi:hypothetical protein